MVAYTKSQQRKKKESEWPRGERDQIKFIDLRFERWPVVRFRKKESSVRLKPLTQIVSFSICALPFS